MDRKLQRHRADSLRQHGFFVSVMARLINYINNSCVGHGHTNCYVFGYLTFKPALGELYKKHSCCAKIHLFKTQNRKLFLGGAQPRWGGDTPPGLLHTSIPRRLKLGNDPWSWVIFADTE